MADESPTAPTPEPSASTSHADVDVTGRKKHATKKGKRIKDQNMGLPASERQGFIFALDLEDHINKMGGQYLRDEDGNLCVLLKGQRIPLNFDRDNHALAALMLSVCGVSTLPPGAQSAIQRLKCVAEANACKMRFRRFSALIDDRLYMPVDKGQLLRVTPKGFGRIANGGNEDLLWLEHPEGEPFRFVFVAKADKEALADFERLCVETQACVRPEMKWFVAMQEGLFPYVRDACPARLITEHIGPSQQGGKTSGAQRFTYLHGLGEVQGDCTAAALGNMGDIGLLVADNKEQANWTTGLVDHFLFLSTGAQRRRSTPEGKLRISRSRPVAVITTIEGVSKDELQNRTIEVEYLVAGPKLDRAPIENEIRQRRHEMLAALAHVFWRWFAVRDEKRPSPNPLPDFRENFQVLADLLRAYEDIAQKPEGWAEQIIAGWARAVAERGSDHEDEFEHPLRRVIRESDYGSADITVVQIVYLGRKGNLYVTEWGSLLSSLQRLNLRDLTLPKNTNGLSRRIRNAKFQTLELLDEKKAPDVQELRHSENRKFIGFFLPDDTSAEPTDPC